VRVFIVDDEQPCVDELAWLLRKYPDIEPVGIFTEAQKALAAAGQACPDAVFLDIDMPGTGGLELALQIQAQCPGVIVIFVTAYAQYALEAFRAFPLDFLLKPVRESRLGETVNHLRAQHALLHPERAQKGGLEITCFGPVEIRASGEAKFPTRWVWELLLYLFDRRGAGATRSEMLEALFEGKNDKNTLNNLYVTLSRLKTLLACWNGARASIRLDEANALIIAPGVCDYTDFMRFAKNNAAISDMVIEEAAKMLRLCRGPYLENETFEWATESMREVEAEYERIALGVSGCRLAAGRITEAENALRALLARNPVSTDGYAALLSLYMRVDNPPAYAALYETYARMLKKEFRIKPETVFREHYARIGR
jgi:two-component SAPR family response regulator